MSTVETKAEYPVAKYLEGSYAPVPEERVVQIEEMTIVGELPDDLTGIYVRNGPNQRYDPVSNYHRYDGDGMLHALEFN